MKSKLLMFIATLVAGTGASVIQAQNAIPYLPMQDNFGGTAITSPNDFLPSSGDYTLEVEGTSGVEINIAKGVITYMPSTTGKVRFAQKSGKVYVYEGNTYKTVLTPGNIQTICPDIFAETDNSTSTTGIYNPANLLSNPGFETNIAIPSKNYEDRTYWTLYNSNKVVDWNGGSGNSIRKGTWVEGEYYMLIHKTGAYLTQTLAAGKLKPNSVYKIKYNYKTNDASQYNATYRVEIGTKQFGTEIFTSKTYVTPNNTNTQIFEASFSTGNNVSTDNPTYFSIHRTMTGSNNANQNLDLLDRVTLVEGIASKGIEGGNNPFYLEGSAYAPKMTLGNEEYFNMTSCIINPSFETGNADGWTNNGFEPQNNTSFGIKDGTYYFQRWQESGNLPNSDIHQTIPSIPNGYYTLTVAAGFGGKGAYIYANKDELEITSDNQNRDYTLYTKVSNGELNIGAKLVSSNSNYMRFDNFRLKYTSNAPADFLAFKQTTLNSLIQEAQTLKNSKMQNSISATLNQVLSQAETNASSTDTDVLDANIQSLSSAIDNAEISIAQYSALQAAIDNANAYKATVTTPSEEAKVAFGNAISNANTVYINGEVENIQATISTLKSAQRIYMIAQPERPLNLTSILANPSFETGNSPNDANSGWTIERNTTGNFDYKYITGKNPTDGSRILNVWAPQINYINVFQKVILPAGVYTLKGDLRTNAEPYNQHIAAIVNEVAKKSSIIKYDPNVEGGWESAANWNHLQVEFVVPQETEVTVGVYSKGENLSGNSRGWFQADNFQLYYLGEGTIVSNNDTITVKGNINVTNLNAALTEQITSVNANEAVIIGEIIPANPNTIVYGLPVGATLQQGISEGSTASLDDTYSFHAPKALAATVSYTRAFNMNGTPCNTTNGNWQTICLPFDVTTIKATQEGNEISLIPISEFTGTEGATDPRPFWLYKIEGTTLTAVNEMNANTPYLIAIPNDNATYKPFYNVSGDIVFNGTQILVTNPETGNTDKYSMTANFTPITANTNDYGINAEGTYFVPNVTINSFSAKVTPVGTGKPAYLSIFGDDSDLTALPSIPSAQLQNGIEVYTIANGVTIQSEKETSLSIFEVSGKLIKEILINEGLNYVTLPTGQYVINGRVIIVK